MDTTKGPGVQPTPAPSPKIVQVPGVDPSVYDMDTAIQTWTDLVNNTLPNLLNSLNYLKGIINGL